MIDDKFEIPEEFKWIEPYLNESGTAYDIPTYKIPRFIRIKNDLEKQLSEAQAKIAEMVADVTRCNQDISKTAEYELELKRKIAEMEKELKWALFTSRFYIRHWYTGSGSGLESIRERDARRCDEILAKHGESK